MPIRGVADGARAPQMASPSFHTITAPQRRLVERGRDVLRVSPMTC
jgi:hypothetical protein